jgi:hypothetical protein
MDIGYTVWRIKMQNIKIKHVSVITPAALQQLKLHTLRKRRYRLDALFHFQISWFQIVPFILKTVGL